MFFHLQQSACNMFVKHSKTIHWLPVIIHFKDISNHQLTEQQIVMFIMIFLAVTFVTIDCRRFPRSHNYLLTLCDFLYL